MRLFVTNQQLHSMNINPLQLRTPLGEIIFKCIVSDLALKVDSSAKVMAKSSHHFLVSWINENYLIDFLRAEFDPVLPSNMKVNDCFAGIWRIKALKKINVNLNAILMTSLNGSPETGEYLMTQFFEDEFTKLSIGTEDEERLEHRAKSQDWLPPRFEQEITADNIRFLENGICVDLALLKDEQLQIKFVVAWSSKSDKELSTWYAVDQSTAYILKQSDFS